MEEKNNLIENKKTDFMDGFKYEIGNPGILLTKHATNMSFASDAPNDLEIKNRLQEFLESGNKKESVNIGSVNLIFKKLIEQNCIIGKETIKYLCDLCSENQKDDKSNLVSENDLIPILLKAEYEHYDKENNNQGKPKIRKCILTNDLFEEIIEKIEKKEIDTDNIKHIFELVGNIVGGLFSTKNQIDEKKILDMVKQFGKENTLDVLCDFFIKGDLSVISAKITFAFAGYHNLVEMILLTKLIGYGKFFANIAKEGAQSATIDLIGLVNDIKTVYENLISNQLNKVKEENKLEWYKLHRDFVFSILNGILLNVTNKAPKEEKQEEEQKFVTSLSNKMEELLVGKEKNNKQEINIINNEVEENDDYDFISAMLEKIYSAVESVLRIDDETIGKLTVNKSADGDLEFVEVIEQGNILSNAFSFFFSSYKPKEQKDPHKFKITDFLKAIWGKLEDKEKNHLKVLVLPIVFKMFGKETWKKEILLHGLKIFGLDDFDQIDNKNLDLIFESAVKIIDNLPNDKESDESKKNKIPTISSELKNIIDVLLKTNDNKNLGQIKNSVDSLIDIAFSLPKDLKDKDGKIDFTKIKDFLDGINKDKEGKKWDALCEVIKPFLADEKFLEKLVASIFEQKSDKEEPVNKEINKKEPENKEKKETWKKDILISGLKLFAGKFDQLSKNIKEILPNLVDLIKIFNEKAEKKDDKQAEKIDFAKIKGFLEGIVQDKDKLKALNSLVKLFCSDESFLTNVVDGILGKDSWKANVLKQGLKLFGVRFDNLKDEALKSILESVAGIMACLTDNRKDKKQKISVITEGTKKIFGILLVGKNENNNFDDLAQNLIDILLSDDLAQVKKIDEVQKILRTLKDNLKHDNNSLNAFNSFFKNALNILNDRDFLLGIVKDVEELKPLIEDNEIGTEGSIKKDKGPNWLVDVLGNLGHFLINDIDNSTEFIDHIDKILDVYKEFAQAIDIPANAKCCKDAFLDLKDNRKKDQLLEDEDSSILQKINAVESVKTQYEALKKFCDKEKFVHDKNETKDDFKQVEKLYKNFMQAFNASNIILTKDEQKKFDKFRFNFEINQTAAVNSVKDILRTINDILHAQPENKRQKKLECVKELIKSVFKDGRILKFITASDELKAIHPILSNAFEQLAKLVEIKIDRIKDVNNFNTFISEDISGLLNMYNKFAEALDAANKNNPGYQTNIIDSVKDMIDCIEKKFLISENQKSQTAYQNLLKAFFSSVKNENKPGLVSSLSNMISSNQNEPDETNILTFVIDKIDNKSMKENSKTALKKSLSCLMPLIKNSVEKKNFKDKLFKLLDSYKALAKELDKSFDFQVAKNFVNNQDIKDRCSRNEKLKNTFDDLSQEINKTVPDTKEIMHKYKLFRNEVQKLAKNGNNKFNLTSDKKNIFEQCTLDQKKAIPAIQNILKSISNFCPDDEKIKNENDIINRNDIGNKKVISVNNSIVKINTNSKNDALNNGNEKSFNMVLINLLQGGDFLKDIIDGIDSKDNADMSDNLKNYIASLSSPLCKFLISYLGQTKDNPSTITNKFNKIMSKYVEIMAEIQADKININNLLKQVVSLLKILENDIIPKGQDMLDNNTQNNAVFEAYKYLCKQIVSNNKIIIKIINETKENLNDEDGKTKKYLNFAESIVPILTYVTGSIVENASNTDFFSKFVSKFKQVYSFSTKKSFAVAVKSLFKKKNKILEAGLQPNEDKKAENQIFKSIFYNLEFERPVNQIKNEAIDTITNDNQDNLSRKNTIEVPLNNGNIMSTSSDPDSAKILDEERKIKDNDNTGTVYLAETLFTKSYRPDQWFLKRWLNKFKDFVQTWFVKKYFNAFKEYVLHATNDNEILTTLDNKIDLTNPMGAYVTFWRITNLLFWRESKWYYPVVVGEIILSLTIFLPFTAIAGPYSLGKYIWTWMFEKNDKPLVPPGDLPPQLENSQVQTNIFIDTGMEKNKADEILVVNNIKEEHYNDDDNNTIMLK